MSDDFEEEENPDLVGVGYWVDPQSPGTEALPDPTRLVDLKWDENERRQVAEYLRNGNEYRSWPGESWCRFDCGIDDREGMGTHDLTDGVFFWPEGFAHYLEKHQVKPPEEFLAHVREQLRSQTEEGKP